MESLKIPPGTFVMFGRAAKPMPQAITDAISQLVRSEPAIREAYLPQCYVQKIVEPPAQILVLVLNNGADQTHVLDVVKRGLDGILPLGMHLDTWIAGQSDSLLNTVRGTRTHLHCTPPPEPKPWWKLFG